MHPRVKSLIKGATAPKMNPKITKMRNDLDKTVDSVKSLMEDFYYFMNGTNTKSLCQSVISGSLTLRNTKIRGFGMNFNFSKIRMEPVMLSFLATTENIKLKIRTTE